jgi:hypothetical protein
VKGCKKSHSGKRLAEFLVYSELAQYLVEGHILVPLFPTQKLLVENKTFGGSINHCSVDSQKLSTHPGKPNSS